MAGNRREAALVSAKHKRVKAPGKRYITRDEADALIVYRLNQLVAELTQAQPETPDADMGERVRAGG